MSKGRPPQGPELVERLDGSDPAKQRLKLILQTLSGGKSIAEACAELGLSESRFHELRTEWLQRSLAPLEPKPLGRPKPVLTAEQAQLGALAQQVNQLQRELECAQVREELALSMPHLFRNAPPLRENAKKKTSEQASKGARQADSRSAPSGTANGSGNSKDSGA